MPSSTSLYTTGNAANTSGGNYTTLYSGGAGVTIPQRAYGNANVVSLLAAGTDGANTIAGIVATGNVTTTANISATGNIYAGQWFVGNIQGDITGNIAAAGSNTQLQFNNNNSLGASGNLTFNNSTNVFSVTGNINGTTVNATTVNTGTATATGNIVGGNVATAGQVTATGNVTGGNVRTAGVVTATGNVTGGNLITAGLVTAATMSATGNITAANFIGNVVGNIVGNIDAAGSNTQVQFNDTGDILGASADFTFNKTTAALAVTGNVTGGNVSTAGLVTATGNVTGGNVNTAGQVSAAGNVTGGNVITNAIVGSGTGNTNLTISPAGTGDVEILDSDAALIVNSGDIQSRQGPGTGNPLTLSANNGSGNNQSSIIIKDISTNSGAIEIYPSGNSAAGALPLVNIHGSLVMQTGYYGGYGNILAPFSNQTIANISASGNVQANYFIGNGSQLTGVLSSISGNLSGNLQGNGYGANAFTFVSAIGNVTGGNIITTGLITAGGNVNVGGNITSGGSISATGNVYGGNLVGPPGQNIGIFADDSYNIHLNADLIRVGDLDTEATIVTNGTGNLVLTTSDDGLTDKSKIKIVQGANANILLTTTGTGQVVTSSLYATTQLTSPNIYAIGGAGAVISSTGNVTALNLNGDAIWAGIVSATGNITGANVVSTGSVSATGAVLGGSISTTGNVTGNYIIGNGSLLTNINAANVVGAYGNANVSNYLASGTNTANIITTGNINGGNLNSSGGVSVAGNITVGDNVTLNTTLSAGGNVIGGNIVTAGQVSAVGDVTTRGALVGNTVQPTFPGVGNSRDLTLNAYGSGNININGPIVTTYAFTTDGNITTNYGNLNATTGGVYAEDGFFGTAGYSQVSVAGNVTGGNIISNANIIGGTANISALLTAGNITSLDRIFANGNIQTTGGIFIGDGSGLFNIPAGNITGAYGNANVANFLANYGSNTIVTTGNITAGNLIATSVTYTPQVESVATDLDLNTAGKINANGNLRVGDNNANTQIATHGTGDLILRTHEGDANQGSITIFDGANGNISIAPNGTGVVTTTTLSASGNINGANLVASANLTSTQQTVIGTANVGTTGNIVVSGKNIATDMAFVPDGGTAATAATSRIVVGTGWAGNITHNSQQQRLVVSDSISRTNTGTSVRNLASDPFVTLNGNVANTSFRQQGLGAQLRIGGGPAANVTALTSAFGAPFSVAAGQFNVDVGNASPYNLGNTSISHVALNGGVLTLNGGSSIGNAYGIISAFVNGAAGTANITNWLGYSSSYAGTGNITGNLFCFYNGNTSTLGTYGVQTPNFARAATNYYFLRNDDDVAQVKLGSLRSYNEYQYALATSGTVNIDKTNAQVQFLAPTANVTIGDFQNFVTTASDSVNNDNQTDTVTLIVQQGATPYTVTMPTGNASIKYLGGTTTVGSTANAVSVVTIKAIRSAANAALYLTAISSEYT